MRFRLPGILPGLAKASCRIRPMLELSTVRGQPEKLRQALESRGLPPSLLEGFLQRDEERRRAITEVESLKAERNRANAEIGRLKKAGGDASAVLEKMKEVSSRIKELDATTGADPSWRYLPTARVSCTWRTTIAFAWAEMGLPVLPIPDTIFPACG